MSWVWYLSKDMVYKCTHIVCSMSEAREQNCLPVHTHLKMSWILHKIHQKDEFLTYQPPSFSPPSASFSVGFQKDSTPSSSSGTRISPVALFVIAILAVLFFVSGLLCFIVKFLIKKPSSQSNRNPQLSTSEALERQLQQLFHQHDTGLDQAFIDALPVFIYKEIVGLKEPFDCAVCLCEFSENDQLRLLPTCSHAFHTNCIDTWLLSNSSCPICRGTLFNPGFLFENPVFDYDDPREEDGFSVNIRNGFSSTQKKIEIEAKKGVFPVRLGKFRELTDDAIEELGGETSSCCSSSNLDGRRCYSMGSYQYLVGDTKLRVALKKQKDVRGIEGNDSLVIDGDVEGKKINIGVKTDSYSISKIWLWPKKGKFASSQMFV